MGSGDNTRPRRGRPAGVLTPNRQRVLNAIVESVAEGGVEPSLRELARRCGLYDFRAARRVRNDLKRMGRLA